MIASSTIAGQVKTFFHPKESKTAEAVNLDAPLEREKKAQEEVQILEVGEVDFYGRAVVDFLGRSSLVLTRADNVIHF